MADYLATTFKIKDCTCKVDIEDKFYIEGLKLVNNSSCKVCHYILEMFAKYLGDSGLVGSVNCDPKSDFPYIAYLFKDLVENEYFGAASFRQANPNIPEGRFWGLSWTWLFPQYRGRHPQLGSPNYFQQLWLKFRDKFGDDFYVEGPLSKSMYYFLKKMNHPFDDTFDFNVPGYEDRILEYELKKVFISAMQGRCENLMMLEKAIDMIGGMEKFEDFFRKNIRKRYTP